MDPFGSYLGSHGLLIAPLGLLWVANGSLWAPRGAAFGCTRTLFSCTGAAFGSIGATFGCTGAAFGCTGAAFGCMGLHMAAQGLHMHHIAACAVYGCWLAGHRDPQELREWPRLRITGGAEGMAQVEGNWWISGPIIKHQTVGCKHQRDCKLQTADCRLQD